MRTEAAGLGDDRRSEMLALIDSAQRAAGVLAARHRGDRAGAVELIDSFTDQGSLAQGSLLLSELLLQLYAADTGREVTETLQQLSVRLEHSVRAAS